MNLLSQTVLLAPSRPDGRGWCRARSRRGPRHRRRWCVRPAVAGHRAAAARRVPPARRRPVPQGQAQGDRRRAGPPRRHRDVRALLRAQPRALLLPARSRGRGAPGRPAPLDLVRDRLAQRRHGPALRPARRAVPAADHRRGLADPRLRDRLHGARPPSSPVLRLPQPLRRGDAHADPLGELRGPVPGLGGRRPGVVPAHRLLAAQAVGRCGRQEGLRHQPRR